MHAWLTDHAGDGCRRRLEHAGANSDERMTAGERGMERRSPAVARNAPWQGVEKLRAPWGVEAKQR